MSFSEELRRYGPEGSCRTVSSVGEAFAYCERLARSHYENFSVASFLLPEELRQPLQVVYAYCRWSDDLADENDGSESARSESLRLLSWWAEGLDDCFSDNSLSFEKTPVHPVYVALKETAARFRLSKKPFADLLVAFRRDQVRQRYETLDELIDYCRYSADPVGRIVLELACAAAENLKPTPEQAAWSDSICTGLQLANFWQDVARDIEIGRCYIPREIAARFDVDPENLRNTTSFRELIRELVRDARERLLAGRPLVESAPKSIRLDIALFVRGGLAVLDAIGKNNYNVLEQRPVVSRRVKLYLLLDTFLRKAFGRNLVPPSSPDP